MRKIIPAVVAGATSLAVAGAAYGYVNVNKDVTLSVDGSQRHLTTMSGTVGDLLRKQAITLAEHDVVAPGVDTKISDGTLVAVQYGRKVTVVVDGRQQSFWTTATNVGQALASLDLDTAGAALSTSRSTGIPREGLSLDIATRKIVTIDAAGTKRVITTTAQTVAEVLAAAKITVDGNDKLSVSKSARLVDGASFRYIRVDVTKVTKRHKIAYQVIRKNSAKLEKGKTKIDVVGHKGIRTSIYVETRENGKLTTRKKTSSSITTKPVSQVVLVGTKETSVEQRWRRRGLGWRLGSARAVRVGRQLVDQHRQRLLRWAPIQPRYLARVRRHRHAEQGQQGDADRDRSKGPG